jgi:7-cyano-7-deazaguanine reductase
LIPFDHTSRVWSSNHKAQIRRNAFEEIMVAEPYDNLSILKRSKTSYPDNPDQARLDSFPNKYASRDYLIEFDCPEFTSLCPVTGQPDFARIKISYIPDLQCLESKSLKIYLFSFRSTGMFHEEITNRILDDMVKACKPRWARIRAVMNPRGGISIDVTAEYCKPDYKRPEIGRSI